MHVPPHLTFGQQTDQRSFDSAAGKVPPEQITDVSTGHPADTGGAQSTQDGVRRWIAEQIAKDVARRGVAIGPERECRFEMHMPDLLRSIE